MIVHPTPNSSGTPIRGIDGICPVSSRKQTRSGRFCCANPGVAVTAIIAATVTNKSMRLTNASETQPTHGAG